MNKNRAIADEKHSVILRSIVEDDLELLRTWKNLNRTCFFYRELISPEMQAQWFVAYQQREHDSMFMVLHRNRRIGCLGFRRLEDRVDFYNIILGDQLSARAGLMASALELLCAEAGRRYPQLPIMVSVLRQNPALEWYYRRGFVLTTEHEDFVELTRNS